MGAKKLEAYVEEVLCLTADVLLLSVFYAQSFVLKSRHWPALLRECPPPLERLPLDFATQSRPAA